MLAVYVSLIKTGVKTLLCKQNATSIMKLHLQQYEFLSTLRYCPSDFFKSLSSFSELRSPKYRSLFIISIYLFFTYHSVSSCLHRTMTVNFPAFIVKVLLLQTLLNNTNSFFDAVLHIYQTVTHNLPPFSPQSSIPSHLKSH